MDKLRLFEEFRLIERKENEVSGVWKGVHLLLFFLAFIFGSFCTFCFHMLMYMFDEKCVLFPKLLALNTLRHSIIFEFIPVDKDKPDLLPVDFLNTQWMDNSVCYLPTYVPLVSGIFGLVWTTIFLMCSTGRQINGLQRPWRVLAPVFIFSLVMSGVCIYSSSVTHNGLNELCVKLSQFTGSSTCAYTVNVATLAYERRIRGVYQAIRLTTMSAWLHTACWLMSAVLVLVRVFMVVDFQLVRITADLQGNVDKMLEHHEKHIRTVSPDLWIKDETDDNHPINRVRFKNKAINIGPYDKAVETENEIIYFTELKPEDESGLSLLPEERNKIMSKTFLNDVPKGSKFIAKIIYNLLESIPTPLSRSNIVLSSNDNSSGSVVLHRQIEEEHFHVSPAQNIDDSDELEVLEIFNILSTHLTETELEENLTSTTTENIKPEKLLTSVIVELKHSLDKKDRNESNKINTDQENNLDERSNYEKEYLTSSTSTEQLNHHSIRNRRPNEVDKETQTPAKEKQD